MAAKRGICKPPKPAIANYSELHGRLQGTANTIFGDSSKTSDKAGYFSFGAVLTVFQVPVWHHFKFLHRLT